jgi:hypothetical protein
VSADRVSITLKTGEAHISIPFSTAATVTFIESPGVPPVITVPPGSIGDDVHCIPPRYTLYEVAPATVVNVNVNPLELMEVAVSVGAAGIIIVPAVGDVSLPAFTAVIVIVYAVLLLSPVNLAELFETPFTKTGNVVGVAPVNVKLVAPTAPDQVSLKPSANQSDATILEGAVGSVLAIRTALGGLSCPVLETAVVVTK